jgi:hypothetical protein
MVIEFISLLLTMAALKGMTGALAPFSYLMYSYFSSSFMTEKSNQNILKLFSIEKIMKKF